MKTITGEMSPYAIPGLKFLAQLRNNKPESLELIIETVLRYRRQSEKEVFTKRRKRELVYTRQLICYVAATRTNVSLKTIGERLCGRDHTTIIHARNTIKDLISVDEEVKNDVAHINQLL